jgi:hypothetical protein
MTKLESLDPDTRCFALVGQFLHAWSTMELCLHDALAAGLRLSDLMQFILCANLQLWAKISVLRTIVDVSSLSADERKKFSGQLQSLGKYSGARNMVAHNPFEPDRDEGDPKKQGVTFGTVKAKGGFSLPPTTWSQAKFKEEMDKVDVYASDLIRLRDKLRTASFDHSRVTRIITILSRPPTDSFLQIS